MNASRTHIKRINPKSGSDSSEPFGNGKNALNSLNSLKSCGGKHRPAIGISTKDSETDDERIERLRRAYYELHEDFDEDRARRAMTVATPTKAKPISLLAAFQALIVEELPW